MAVVGRTGAPILTAGPVVLAPLRFEAAALRRGGPGLRVVRSGAGPLRSVNTAERLSRDPAPGAVAVAGVAGGLVSGLAPGTVVVADRVIGPAGDPILLPSAPLLAAELKQSGLPVLVGTVASAERLVTGSTDRADLAARGAVAVDKESFFLLSGLGTARAAAVVRVVVDTPEQELASWSTIAGGWRALRHLAETAPALSTWASAVRSRKVLLAGPRSFCAGVERAITTVERTLDRFGPPVYVRRQIVHNSHVVAGLEERGASFVSELDEVPDGGTVVFSAHGVSRAVRAEADRRLLNVVDATCPLVAKVHHEVRRFTERKYQVILIGHGGHDETEGTLGEADGITLVETVDDVASMEVADPGRVAYVTQTTLSPSDVAGVVDELSARFPSLVGPPAADICYATQNRQDAVAAIAADCDLVLVVGSANSSNAARLVEVAARSGAKAVLLEDERDLTLAALAGVATVGVTAAASTPATLVDRVVAALSALGQTTVEERTTKTENVNFPLPVEVR